MDYRYLYTSIRRHEKNALCFRIANLHRYYLSCNIYIKYFQQKFHFGKLFGFHKIIKL